MGATAAPPWARRIQRVLGLMLVALITAEIVWAQINFGHMGLPELPQWQLFRVFHLVLGCLIGFRIIGQKGSSLVGLYLWAVAMAVADGSGFDSFMTPGKYMWWFVKCVSVPVHLRVLMSSCKCGCPCGTKLCCVSIFVVFLAMAANVALFIMPTMVPQDVVPHRGPATIVETPTFRVQQCATGSSTDYKYMCEGIKPLSWEDAEAKAERTLAKMTMKERHSLMQGVGWKGVPIFMLAILPLPALPLRGYYMGTTPPNPRLGIPALKLHDAGNGFRNNPAPVGKPFTTIMWPSSLAFGATWNPELVQKVASAIGKEYRGKGANVILGPSVQVHRVARNGRNFEYMAGEDPYLGARLTEAYVKGVQGEGVIACLKHYGFNEQETNRNGGNFVVDERTAWELYYPPFEAGVAAGAGSVMCSYNRINGTYACASEELLARDLKGKMGFRGFVMSDWWALHDEPENSIPRGFDMEMPGAGADTRFYAERLKDLEDRKAGTYKGHYGLSRELIYDEPARRILATAYKMRLDQRPSCTPGGDCAPAIESDQRSPENSDLAKRTATESVVLLKNEGGVLPVDPSKVKTIALIGAPLGAQSMGTSEVGMAGDYYSGGGSGHCYVEKESLRTPLHGLVERAQSAGMRVLTSPSNDVLEGVKQAQQADLVIVSVATTAEEGQDRASLSLDGGADELIRQMRFGRPVVVLVQAPGVVFMPWADSVQGIGFMFLAGEYTSHAWEAVVFGDVSPSGKLPIMIPKDHLGIVEPGSFPTPTENHYSEGLFTSYRMKNANELAAFPFGHGLSYTNFTYDKPVQLPKSECEAYACVRVKVTNSGASGRSGNEVAQAYVEFPPEAEEPKLVLRGFRRTALLKPGAGEEVTFSFTERDFSIYVHGGWQVQSGIVVHVGASSGDLRHSLPLRDPSKAPKKEAKKKAKASEATS